MTVTRPGIEDPAMLVLSREDVRALLDLDDLIDALGSAMADLSAGRASVPDRIGALVPEREGRLMAMPGYVPSLGALVSKLVSLFPHNAGTAVPTHQAVIVSFDAQTGSPTALLDGTEITAVRTGACSALSARLLAREDASVLAVLGTGVQARSHARGLVRVRPIRELRIAGRDLAKAHAFAAEMARELDLEARAADSYRRRSRARTSFAPQHTPPTRWCTGPGVRRGRTSPRSATTRWAANWMTRRLRTRSCVWSLAGPY